MARQNLAGLYLASDLPAEWNSREFRAVIESNLYNLKTLNVSRFAIVDSEAYHYRGDFYSLLVKYNQPAKYHWIILRMHNLYSPVDFDGKAIDLTIPDEDYIQNIWDIYRTTYGQ